MSNIIYLFLFSSFIYSQCNEYNEFNCSNDDSCEWVENMEWGSCSDLNPYMNNGVSYCNDTSTSTDQCYTYTCYGGGYGQWNVCCDGSDYEIDNSYCQETGVILPECSGLEQGSCNHPLYGEGCEWIEDIEASDCSVFDNSESSCTSYPGECFWDEDITYASCDYPNSGSCNSAQGCYWDCSDYGWYCDCYGQQQIIDTECIGQYEMDNSYCQEVEQPECSDMNEIQCNSDDGCSWYEDIDGVSCASLSVSECSEYFDDGCSLDADCVQWGSWYTWICYEYGPSYCTGGNIEIDNSSCEEIEYQLGDINGDLSINVLDIVEIVNLIVNDGYNVTADIDSNGAVNVLDIIQIINIIIDRS